MDAPPAPVIAAFGGDAENVERLAGGQGRSWRTGAVVLKPEAHEASVHWAAGFVDKLEPDGRFRISTPVVAADGRWIVDGWAATSWVEGAHASGAWDRILDVSAAFHTAAAATGAEPSDVLTARDDPWAVGERVAWGEAEPAADWAPELTTLLDRLAPLLAQPPPDQPRQVIHGDLGGNVLFADDAGLPPALIDLAPYYRPAAWADAIVVADAVAWEAAPATLAVKFLARHSEGDQLLARAIAFRAVAAGGLWPKHPVRVKAEIDGYAPLLPLLRGI